ncbi:MAG: 3D domain-containing protein [Candidatus Edwardsbacteria bacterium]|nr:3D domain-containing protein [Candidatus Edwardsbacteria bacterium]
MTRTSVIFFLVVLCLLLLFLYAANLFTLTVVYRLQLIEQDLDFMIRQQDVHLENQGEIKNKADQIRDKIDQLLDIFAGATSEAPLVDEFTVTAYAPLDPAAVEGMCYSGDPNVTASGLPPIPGETVAAGPGIPFGSRVWIEGLGIRTVNDRGGRITDNHLDVVFATRKDALSFGRQNLKGAMLP